MKRLYYYFLMIICFCSTELQARTNESESEINNNAGNFVQNKDLDRELIIYLHDKTGNPIQCTHPEKNGNFLFTELSEEKYCICIVNVNGFKSERYCVTCKKGTIYENLNNVLKAENLVPAESHFDSYSCEAKSDLNLSLTPSPLSQKSDIQFNLTTQSNVLVIISNEQGDKVQILPIGELKPGIHSVSFDTSGLSAGSYQVATQAGKQQGSCSVKVK